MMGGKTFVLSLPSAWIKKYQITKGEELDLEEKENSIIVRTEKRLGDKEISVDFSCMEVMLGRALGSLYKSGYTRAKISYGTKEQLQNIEDVLQRSLVGFSITKQEANYIVIESIAEAKVEEFDVSLKRLFYSLELMNEELVTALGSSNIQALEKVIEKDGQINRHADLCRRIIVSGQTQFLSKPAVLYYVVEQLERIGDFYKAFAQKALEKSFVFSSSAKKIFQEIQKIFIQFRTLFYKFSFEGFEDFGKNFYTLRIEIKKLIKDSSSEEKVLFLQQSFLLETIIDMNGALPMLSL